MLEGIIAKVQQLLNRAGQSTDSASSTGSLHAKASDIRNQTGASGDASSATGSLHAKVADVKGSLGNTNDAASSTGTVNAKLADVKSTLNTVNTNMATSTQATNIQNAVNAIPTNPMRPRSTYTGNYTLAQSATLTTVLNITGTGNLRSFSQGYSGYAGCGITIIVDGRTLINNLVPSHAGPEGLSVGLQNSVNNFNPTEGLVSIPFKNSLQIQLTGSSTGATNWYWLYELE